MRHAADGSWTTIRDPDSSANAVAQAIAADPASVVELRYEDLDDASGFYDPILRNEQRSLIATRADGRPLAREEFPGLFRALALESKSVVDPKWDIGPWNVTHGQAVQTRRTILWRAIANNALAAAALLGFVWSLAWIPREFARQHRRERLEAGLCPRCGYDRRATAPGAPCPECGSPFSVG